MYVQGGQKIQSGAVPPVKPPPEHSPVGCLIRVYFFWFINQINRMMAKKTFEYIYPKNNVKRGRQRK